MALIFESEHPFGPPGCVAQSAIYLTINACLTADPGVAISIPAQSHTFVEIDREIISIVRFIHKKGCC